MSLFDRLLLGALRDALQGEQDDDDDELETTVTRTDRYVFNEKHSGLISLSPDKRTATRQLPMLSFDQGIVFSDQPLHDNEVFEVCIDQMMPNSRWKGSVEIGVTGINPSMISDLPKTMTDLTIGTWMLTGNQVVNNGRIIRRGYCQSLTTLPVGSRVGVCRTDNGSLHFFINGRHQGVAATDIPQGVYGVVDIYGNCAKVSIVSPGGSASNPSMRTFTAPGGTTPDDAELVRYKKQRKWIEECRSRPFSLWFMNRLMGATSDDEKRELFLFINAFGHRLDQDTITCDGCERKVRTQSHRYRCMECQNLDLCDSCFSSRSAPDDHQFHHKVAEIRWTCDGNDCGGLITGTRFQCMVCDHFNLCVGCFKTKNWPPRHKESHAMTKSSTLTVQTYDQPDGARATATTINQFCPPGKHDFIVGRCMVCTSCGECTGYGSNCTYSAQLNPNILGRKIQLCDCGGYGDAGCRNCGICKNCAKTREVSRSVFAQKPVVAPTRTVTNKQSVPPKPDVSPRQTFTPRREVPPSPVVIPKPIINSQKCEYRERCERFVKSLNIADEYFDKTPAFNKCFCEPCHKARGDRECYSRGNPSKTYALPIGWSRFSIKVGPHANVLKIFENWHVAFHGTQAKYLQPIFNNGAQLLMAGDVALGGNELQEGEGHYNDKWKPTGFDTKKIFLSPSIKYSGCPVYAKKQRFIDPVTKKTVFAQVALQVLIRPGSYEVGRTTVQRTQPFDANFSDDVLEWSTKERGAVVVTGLLVKIVQG